MVNNNFLIISCIVITLLLTFIQVTNFSFLGVKPNLALVGLVVSATLINSSWIFFLLAATVSFMLKFQPGFDLQILIFLVMSLMVYFFSKRSSWQPFLNINIFVLLFTTIFYLLSSVPSAIASGTFLKEIVYNIIIANFLLTILYQNKFCYGQKEKN